METCNEWLIDKRLSLHLGKTEAMLCGVKCKIKIKEGFGSKMQGHANRNCYRSAILELMINETLSGEGILDTIVRKCTGRIKFL